jgi:hypothetical protein
MDGPHPIPLVRPAAVEEDPRPAEGVDDGEARA